MAGTPRAPISANRGRAARLLVGGIIGWHAGLVVAIITAKASDITAFSDIFGLSEFLYIVLFIWLIVAGPGAVSVDHFLARRLPQLAKRA